MGLLLVAIVSLHILRATKPSIYTFETVPSAEAALILGARVYKDGRLSDMLRDRVETALDLYRARKVTKLLVSGDHGQTTYDEVNTIRAYLLAAGVPQQDIFLDHAGFDTYDSVYRAKAIFEASTIIIPTQAFHLPRALYLAQGVRLKAYGVAADRQIYQGATYAATREFASRFKAFLNITFHSTPKFLGEKIPLTGDSKKSWDTK